MAQPPQSQDTPGFEKQLTPQADHGEESYRGCDKLAGKSAVITGGDSGIGRAVAIAYAREGADLLITYLPEEEEDAQETKRWVEQAGKRCVLYPGDLTSAEYCRSVIRRAVEEFGKLDILVNNAAFQMSRDSLEEISDEEWLHTFNVNIHAQFFLTKEALKHMKPGAAIVNTTSVNSDKAPPKLIPYSATKAAIANFTASLGQSLGEKGIRVNSVAPGPIWTPLIPSTMPPDTVASFGEDVPMKRPGQPKEVATLFVFLASDDSSYVTGARFAVTGGTPVL